MPKIFVLFVTLCVNNGTKLVINISKLLNDKTGWLLNYLHRVALSLFQCVWYNYPRTMITQTQTTGISVLIVSFFFTLDKLTRITRCSNQPVTTANIFKPRTIVTYSCDCLHLFINISIDSSAISPIWVASSFMTHAVLSSLPLNSPHRKPLYLQTRCMHTCHICHLHSAANPS